MRLQDAVVDFGVDVLRVDKCAIDIKYARTNGWELRRHREYMNFPKMWE